MIDVAIIGAGQSGLAVGHALKRQGVTNIALLDRSPEGYEGVWDTYARNYEMRSPKEIVGMDLGVPSLTVESFFTARHGAAAWAAIRRVPRTDWMDYLRWYRSIAELPIENGVEVTDIAFDAEGVTLALDDGRALRARLVVLATGMDGGGCWQTPELITDNLPPERYNHSSDMFDVARLAGKAVGIMGAGAAAFDVAVAALDAGARSVDMFVRRERLSMVDLLREMETAGHLNHAHELSDETKWQISRFMSGLTQAPAEHHFLKACEAPNFQMHLGAPWTGVGMEDGRVRVRTPRGAFAFDHVFAATGVAIDMRRRPELRRIAEKAAFWRDRFVPPGAESGERGLGFPYLGPCYQFTEAEPGAAPGLERIFAFNALAGLSMGALSAVSISSHRFGIPRVVAGLTGHLFREQEHQIVATLSAFREPAFTLSPRARAMLGLAEDAPRPE